MKTLSVGVRSIFSDVNWRSKLLTSLRCLWNGITSIQINCQLFSYPVQLLFPLFIRNTQRLNSCVNQFQKTYNFWLEWRLNFSFLNLFPINSPEKKTNDSFVCCVKLCCNPDLHFTFTISWLDEKNSLCHILQFYFVVLQFYELDYVMLIFSIIRRRYHKLWVFILEIQLVWFYSTGRIDAPWCQLHHFHCIRVSLMDSWSKVLYKFPLLLWKDMKLKNWDLVLLSWGKKNRKVSALKLLALQNHSSKNPL